MPSFKLSTGQLMLKTITENNAKMCRRLRDKDRMKERDRVKDRIQAIDKEEDK